MRTVQAAILFVTLLAGSTIANAAETLADAEQRLRKADAAWLSQSPARAAPLYAALLKDLPEEAEPFRATIVLRLARARLAAGDKAGALAALGSLASIDYVPEHHALVAKELNAVIAGKGNPGLRATPIPPVGKVGVRLLVRAGAAAGGNGSEDKPLANLAAAVAWAGAWRAKGGRGAVDVVLAPGTYRQQKTLALTAEDAGTAESPLVIRSLDPTNPAVLTGGTVLRRWKKLAPGPLADRVPAALRHKVRVCDLKANGAGKIGELVFGGFSSARANGVHHSFLSMPVPELFYKGEPQIMARWPDKGLTWLPVNTAPKKPAPRFARWAREENLWLYGYWHWDWADAYEKVASVDKTGRIHLVPPTNRYGFRRRQGCAVNALCELDQPGEWYLDTRRALVCYYPPEGFDPAQCVLSSFGTVVSAEGCSHLQLRDLRVQYVRGDALRFKDCSHLLLAGLDISRCSGMGVHIQGGRRHLVHSCRIRSMGRGGIYLGAGDWRKLVPSHSTVENCRIADLSRIDRTYTPALLPEGMGIRIRHNAFVNIPSSAIRLEGSDCLIELNYFHRCVYESGDQGAIDMWANPLYRGNIIRWNDFDRIINNHSHYGAAAVRHDDFISGFMVTENVFRKGSRRGFGSVQFNQGTDNYVEGNIIVDWHRAFTGRSTAGPHWTRAITSHPNSKRMLAETDWKSDAWRKKYPMVHNLLNGDDNHNYLVDNRRFGTGTWGGVGRAVLFANTDADKSFHAPTRESVKSLLVPWHPIPVDRIGPYSGD